MLRVDEGQAGFAAGPQISSCQVLNPTLAGQAGGKSGLLALAPTDRADATVVVPAWFASRQPERHLAAPLPQVTSTPTKAASGSKPPSPLLPPP